jgi:hypothetical protein
MQALIRNFKNNNINNWAETTLSSIELAQFRAAFDANFDLWESYKDQGLFTLRDIQETVHSIILDADISIITGQVLTMSSGVSFESLSLHTDYIPWLDRYNQETGGDTLTPLVE